MEEKEKNQQTLNKLIITLFTRPQYKGCHVLQATENEKNHAARIELRVSNQC